MSTGIQVALRMDGTSQVLDYQDYVVSAVGTPYVGEVASQIIEAQPPSPFQGPTFRVLDDRLFVVDPGSPPPLAEPQ